MDKFEAAMQNMAKVPPQEGMKTLQAVMAKCMCGQCPTYTPAAGAVGEGFFCGTGKSFGHVTTEVNCMCGTCPNKADLGLKYGFFCMRGSEKALRYDPSMAKK